MFLRRTTYKMAPEFDSADGQAEFERTMRAALRPQDIRGLISTSHIPNEDGSWSVVAIWVTEDHALAETPRIRAVWDQLSANLAGPPQIEVGGVTLNETY